MTRAEKHNVLRLQSDGHHKSSLISILLDKLKNLTLLRRLIRVHIKILIVLLREVIIENKKRF